MAKAKVVGVSVGADGTAWCCDSAGFLYMRDQGTWKRNPGAKNAAEVAVGNVNNVWCRTKNGDVFQLDGKKWNSSWRKETAAKDAQTISVGSDGTVWAGNSKRQLVKRNSLNNWSAPNPTAKAVEVSVGSASEVWCRSPENFVFKLKGSNWNAGWEKDTLVSWVRAISTGGDGTVWLTAQAPEEVDRMWMRMGPNKWNKNPSGYARQICVGSADHVWCTNKNGDIFRNTSPTWDSGWTAIAKPDLPTLYTVVRGDTLSEIVQDHYKLSGSALVKKVNEIADLNGIEDPDEIDAGDVIILP